jgi:hypothetical protein
MKKLVKLEEKVFDLVVVGFFVTLVATVAPLV